VQPELHLGVWVVAPCEKGVLVDRALLQESSGVQVCSCKWSMLLCEV
jgi:hypothetical protein